MVAKKSRYCATTSAGYHHSGGFVAPGEVALLTEDEALRGINNKVLVAAQSPRSDANSSQSKEEN